MGESMPVAEASNAAIQDDEELDAAAPAVSAPRERSAEGTAFDCAAVATIGALGDTWSFLVLRELFFGVRRFNDIQRDLNISRSVLTSRLARLVDLGIARAVPYQDPGERVRHEYRLTRKGVALLPVIVALKEWGDEYLTPSEPVVLRDAISGEPVHTALRTSSRTVAPNEIEVVHPRVAAARQRRTA